jgi:hypothetical protein
MTIRPNIANYLFIYATSRSILYMQHRGQFRGQYHYPNPPLASSPRIVGFTEK